MSSYDFMYAVPREEYERLKTSTRASSTEPAHVGPVEHIGGDVHGSQVNNIEVTNGGTVLIGEDGLHLPPPSSRSQQNEKQSGEVRRGDIFDSENSTSKERTTKKGKSEKKGENPELTHHKVSGKKDAVHEIQWSRKLRPISARERGGDPRSESIAEGERKPTKHSDLLRNQQERMGKHVAERMNQLRGISKETPMDISDDENDPPALGDGDVDMIDPPSSKKRARESSKLSSAPANKKSVRSAAKRAHRTESEEAAKRGREGARPLSPSRISPKNSPSTSPSKKVVARKTDVYGKRERDEEEEGDENSYSLWKKPTLFGSRGPSVLQRNRQPKRDREEEEDGEITFKKSGMTARARRALSHPPSAQTAGRRRAREEDESEIKFKRERSYAQTAGRRRAREGDESEIEFKRARSYAQTAGRKRARGKLESEIPSKKRAPPANFGKKRMREEEDLTRDELEWESEIPFKKRGTSHSRRRPPSPPTPRDVKKRLREEESRDDSQWESEIPSKKRAPPANFGKKRMREEENLTRDDLEWESEIPFKRRGITYDNSNMEVDSNEYPLW